MDATVDTFYSRQLAQPRLVRPAAHDSVFDIRRQAAHCANHGVDTLAWDESRDAEQPIAARRRTGRPRLRAVRHADDFSSRDLPVLHERLGEPAWDEDAISCA